jgi:hypothetical protein
MKPGKWQVWSLCIYRFSGLYCDRIFLSPAPFFRKCSLDNGFDPRKQYTAVLFRIAKRYMYTVAWTSLELIKHKNVQNALWAGEKKLSSAVAFYCMIYTRDRIQAILFSLHACVDAARVIWRGMHGNDRLCSMVTNSDVRLQFHPVWDRRRLRASLASSFAANVNETGNQ